MMKSKVILAALFSALLGSAVTSEAAVFATVTERNLGLDQGTALPAEESLTAQQGPPSDISSSDGVIEMKKKKKSKKKKKKKSHAS